MTRLFFGRRSLSGVGAAQLKRALVPAGRAATVHCAGRERPAIRFLTDPETGVASGVPEAAICVQDIDVQCVLQFTLINAAGCALHRRTNQVIHRQECFSVRRSDTTASGRWCERTRQERFSFEYCRSRRPASRVRRQAGKREKTDVRAVASFVGPTARRRPRWAEATL